MLCEIKLLLSNVSSTHTVKAQYKQTTVTNLHSLYRNERKSVLHLCSHLEFCYEATKSETELENFPGDINNR